MLLKRLLQINDMVVKMVGILMRLTVAAMAVLIILSVLVRNLFGFSFQWIVDVNRLIFIWMCFLGLIYVSDKDQLIRFDIIDKNFSPGVHKALTLIRYVCSLFLFGIMAKAGMDVSRIAKVQVFSTILVSTSWLYYAVIVAGVLLLLQMIMKIYVLLFPPAYDDLPEGTDLEMS